MPKLLLPSRKLSESNTPVNSSTGPSLSISSSLSPTNVPVANPNTRIPSVPTLNTGATAPTSVLSLSPLFIDGNPHGKAVTPPTLLRPPLSSNRRKGPPRLVACGTCSFNHFSCHYKHPN